MTTATIQLPSGFQHIVGLVSRGFGVSAAAATLMLLQAVSIAAGGAFRIRSPEMRDHAPGLDLGLIAKAGLTRGAFLMLLGAIIDAARSAREFRGARGLEHTKAVLEARLCEYGDALRSIQTLEAEPAAAEAERSSIDGHNEASAGGPQPGLSAEASNFKWDTSPQLQQRLDEFRKRRDEFKLEVADLRLQLSPYIFSDDGGWHDLPAVAAESPDGCFAQLSFSPATNSQLLNLPGHKLRACAEIVQRSRIGSCMPGPGDDRPVPAASICISATPELWSRLLSRSSIHSSGLLDGLIWLNADPDDAQFDPAAVAELQRATQWQNFMNQILRTRMCDGPQVMVLNPEGFSHFVSFRKWCQEFTTNVPARLQGYFESWPDAALRLALTLSLLEQRNAEDNILATSCLESATKFLEAHLPGQLEFLQEAVTGCTRADELMSGADRVVRRLRSKGPLTLRGIVRGFDHQDYEIVGRWAREARAQGLIEQQGALFFLKNVSVGPSAAPNVVNFEEEEGTRA